VTFGLSALILLTGVRSRPVPGRPGTARASLWSVSADGVRIVFGSRLLLTLLLFGWLAGFYIVPEGLAAPYARSLHGNALTVGLLMAALSLGMVIGAFVISRIAAPSARIRMMGWLAVLSCAPLIGSAWNPPLWAVLTLWDAGGRGRRLPARRGRRVRAGAAPRHQGPRVRRRPVRPVRRAGPRHPGRRRDGAADRRPARHELDAPARPTNQARPNGPESPGPGG
jgi:hypothetical protein